MKNNGKTKEKVIRLDERVDLILQNHIPHIYEEIKTINVKYDRLEEKLDAIRDRLAFINGKTVVVGALLFLAAEILITHFLK